jgi:hypothetical protein
LAPLQNTCGELALGAPGVGVTVTTTALRGLSQPLTVWLT